MSDLPTLQNTIDATCYIALPERHEFIRSTFTRLWDRGFFEWYTLLQNIGGAIYQASGGRLYYNVALDGFARDSTVGMMGLALFADGGLLCPFIPALQGDFAGGLSNSENVHITVAEIKSGGRLSKPAGAALEPIEAVTFADVAGFARRMLAELERVQHQVPEPVPARPGLLARLFGKAETGQA